MKVGIVSLGCPKNLTDTEVILGKLAHAGYEITNDERSADILIINTCAFIRPAIDEALREIRRALKLKANGIIKHVVVAGCLPQRARGTGYGKRDAEKVLKKVDAVVGAGNINKIVDVIKNLMHPSPSPLPPPRSPHQRSCLFDSATPRIKATPRHYSYIKIADGCNNRCSYCSVPSIRGPYRSRPIEDIVKEASGLANAGTRELILVAQDTTYYGRDLYGKFMLARLLQSLAGIPKIKWIRLMYAHPAHFTDALIRTIAGEKKIVKYIDLPIQHICDNILGLMRRRMPKQEIVDLVIKIRRSVPGIAIRTTFIVGFPGESKADFDQLLGFIEKEKFERLGIFTYYRESGTPAAKLRGRVPEAIKRSRYRKAMRLQGRISRKNNLSKLNQVMEVILDRKAENSYIGRTYADAPDIDGSVMVSVPKGAKEGPKVGEVVRVRIFKASSYDLFGTLVT